MCVLFNNFMILFVQPLDPIVPLAFVWGVAGLQKNKREQVKCTNDKIHEISECRNEQRLMYSLSIVWAVASPLRLREFVQFYIFRHSCWTNNQREANILHEKKKRKYFIISSDIKFEHNLSVQLGQRVCTEYKSAECVVHLSTILFKLYPTWIFMWRVMLHAQRRQSTTTLYGSVTAFMLIHSRCGPLSLRKWTKMIWQKTW